MLGPQVEVAGAHRNQVRGAYWSPMSPSVPIGLRLVGPLVPVDVDVVETIAQDVHVLSRRRRNLGCTDIQPALRHPHHLWQVALNSRLHRHQPSVDRSAKEPRFHRRHKAMMTVAINLCGSTGARTASTSGWSKIERTRVAIHGCVGLGTLISSSRR